MINTQFIKTSDIVLCTDNEELEDNFKCDGLYHVESIKDNHIVLWDMYENEYEIEEEHLSQFKFYARPLFDDSNNLVYPSQPNNQLKEIKTQGKFTVLEHNDDTIIITDSEGDSISIPKEDFNKLTHF